MSHPAKILIAHREQDVLILTINDAASRNAIATAVCRDIAQALRDADDDPNVGAVIITGAGEHFCSGGNLHMLATRREVSRAERRANVEVLHDAIRTIGACTKPVIAAVEGAAAGAGLSLALACDLLVAAKNAVFSVAYVKVGLTPDGGATAFLSEFVSRQVLTELCLTGAPVSGERLYALGAVNRLSDAGVALAEAIQLATRIARGPALATARIKHLCRQAPRNPVKQQLDMEADYMALSLESEESREGIAAFLEKRPADYARLRGQELRTLITFD